MVKQMKESKELIKINSGIVNKIFEYIKNLFSKKQAISESQTVYIPENKESFSEKLQTGNDLKADEVLKIQEKFSAGLIQEEDISDEDKEKLEELYMKQIEDLEKSIEGFKYEIIGLKKKLEA